MWSDHTHRELDFLARLGEMLGFSAYRERKGDVIEAEVKSLGVPYRCDLTLSCLS